MWLPAARAAVLKVALPVLSSVPLPKVVAPSLKVTVPWVSLARGDGACRGREGDRLPEHRAGKGGGQRGIRCGLIHGFRRYRCWRRSSCRPRRLR